MVASIVRLTRRRSVCDLREVKARFMFRSLANRDDPDALPALSVGYLDGLVLDQPQREETPLSVEFPNVFCCQRESAKDFGCVAKVDAMLT